MYPHVEHEGRRVVWYFARRSRGQSRGLTSKTKGGCMNEQKSSTVLAVGVGIMAGIALLLGISAIITNSMSPVVSKMAMFTESQSQGKKIEGLEKKIDALDQKLSTIAASLEQVKPTIPSDAPNQPPAEDFNKVYILDVGSTPVSGKANAPVMITMFADFECSFCAKFYEPIKEVLKAYPDKVKFMIKNFPLDFHKNALPAAKAALAAGLQGKYFEMADLLMQNKGDASEAKLKEYAQALRLNEKKLLEDLKSKDAEFDKQIKEDLTLVERSDVQGTPTFFLNGKKSKARDLNSWKVEIDRILSGR
jgi:protein-disulfide isomerase